MTKISVILPVFNESKLVNKAISTILSQSLDDIEIICVDDGSTDNSLEILNGYASQYDFINVISQINQGPGGAKNTGMLEAKGEYIAFLDADDFFISNNALERLYDAAVENDADVVSGNIKLVDADGAFAPFIHLDYYTQYGKIRPEEYGIPWSFYKNIYKKDFLDENGIRFPDLIRGEDPVFLAEVLAKVNEIYTVPVDVYAYFYIDGFIKIDTYKKIYDHMKHYKIVFDYLKESRFDEIRDKFRVEMMGFIDLMGLERAEYVIRAIKDIFHDDPDTLSNCKEYMYFKYKDNDEIRKLIDIEDSSNPRVSVIMSMKDIDGNFEESVNSIINQTLDDFELICYNDKDSNPILNELADKDSRIRIHNEISNANEALDVSRGDYIYFFNPKGNMLSFALEELYKNAISNKSDVVLFKLSKYLPNEPMDYDSPIYNFYEKLGNKIFTHYTFDYMDIKDHVLSKPFISWNKFFKKDYLKRYCDFEIGDIAQKNILFNLQSILMAKTLSFSNDFYYSFRGGDYPSLNRNYCDGKIFSIIDSVESFLKRENCFDELEYEFCEFKAYQILLYLSGSYDRQYYSDSKKALLKINPEMVKKFPDALLEVYDFAVNSDSREECGAKMELYSQSLDDFNKLYDLQLKNDALLNLNQFLWAENNRLDTKVSTLTRRNTALTDKNKKLTAKNKKLNKTNSELMSSNSWKVTKPLRTVKRIF